MSGAPRSLGELAHLCGAELRRASPADVVSGVAPLGEASPGDVSFYANPAYRKELAGSRASVILVSSNDASLPELGERALLIASFPAAAFARISALFNPPPEVAPGIDALARIEVGAEVSGSARIDAFAVIAAGARIGPGAVIMAGAYVGRDARIGAGTRLHPRAVVLDGCIVGDRCTLHAGVVIGADGFGFAFDPEGDGEGPMHRKMPQAGIARLEDDVEIGANSCVDRATFGETVIGRGTKIDNLVQVGHNCVIGPLCVIAAQAGIAGSTTVGTGAALGGQAGLSGHIHVGDLARIAPQAGVPHDVAAGTAVGGSPSVESKSWMRAATAFPRLPDLLREVRALRRRLGALEGGARRTDGSER